MWSKSIRFCSVLAITLTTAPALRARGEAAAPAGYTVLASQGSGCTLFVLKPDVRSAKAGVLAALRDLKKVFDDKPAIGGAFGDTKDQQCRAGFTAKLKGQAVKGFVACGVGEKGAAITVVYDRAGAPAAELASLTAALPDTTKWVVHQLPGGSGTIKLPADWKITGSSAIGMVMAEGPAGQSVGMGVGAQVVAPDSFLAPQVRANGSMLVAPFCDPVTAIKTLTPQLSMMSQRKGGPAITLEKIISSSPTPAQLPNGQAAWVYYSCTKTAGGKAQRVRDICRLECYPVTSLGWAFATSYATGPDATFDRDLPTMIQISQSWQLNDAAVQGNARAMINAQNQAFNSFQQSMRERNAAFDSYMQSVQNNERIRDKCNANFDEVIRGYRAVEDTTTGERKDVDLGYSKEIVDKLNEKEGYNRYKEIPLRDQY